MPKLIVVTGAAGFIGRNTVAALNARGADHLLLVDSLGRDEKWRNLEGLVFEDILDPQAFLDLLATSSTLEIDAVIHLGADSSTTQLDADHLLRNNYQYTRSLCTWCMNRDVRFIYASSAATYGDGSLGYFDDDLVTPCLRPLNMYGYSKHMFDLWALRSKCLDRIVGLKYFNVFGPYEDHKNDMRSVVNKSFRQIVAGGKISLFKSYRPDIADGDQKRDFIYVKDAVDVTLHFLEDRRPGGLFNCGSGHARSWKELAMAVFAAMDRAPEIEYIEMPEALRAKYQYFTQADLSKLRRAGYSAPFTSIEDGVREYVRSYLMEKAE
ncbi:MAG: ADP-glyceromanno-heptose 6-epimerase [Terracidiphilus sp.]|nr:ADP-glyceromanno-heptose 6-epimerase [Terracidiphilus sp.]